MLFNSNKYFVIALLLVLGACTSGNHIVKSARSEYQVNNSVAVDSAIIKTYLPYKVQLEAEMNKVIGYAEVVLTKKSEKPESVLGNFFADAAANQVKKIVPGVDIVFPTTKGGLRNDINKGDIMVSDVFELMPFENQFVLLELNGNDVNAMLKWIAATDGQPINGLKMNIKNGLPDQVMINGKVFDPNKTYKVITSDYLANGGDDSQGFSSPISRKNIGLLIRDALLKEVADVKASGNKINAKVDGRITKN
jgi:2',3'-cyclic-nucleotide 2'-phosphodiesterase (5'-nucleotidase family)